MSKGEIFQLELLRVVEGTLQAILNTFPLPFKQMYDVLTWLMSLLPGKENKLCTEYA